MGINLKIPSLTCVLLVLWQHAALLHKQWRIQDFPQGGAPTLKIAIIFQIFAGNCMKMKEFGPRGTHVPGAPP